MNQPIREDLKGTPVDGGVGNLLGRNAPKARVQNNTPKNHTPLSEAEKTAHLTTLEQGFGDEWRNNEKLRKLYASLLISMGTDFTVPEISTTYIERMSKLAKDITPVESVKRHGEQVFKYKVASGGDIYANQNNISYEGSNFDASVADAMTTIANHDLDNYMVKGMKIDGINNYQRTMLQLFVEDKYEDDGVIIIDPISKGDLDPTAVKAFDAYKKTLKNGVQQNATGPSLTPTGAEPPVQNMDKRLDGLSQELAFEGARADQAERLQQAESERADTAEARIIDLTNKLEESMGTTKEERERANIAKNTIEEQAEGLSNANAIIGEQDTTIKEQAAKTKDAETALRKAVKDAQANIDNVVKQYREQLKEAAEAVTSAEQRANNADDRASTAEENATRSNSRAKRANQRATRAESGNNRPTAAFKKSGEIEDAVILEESSPAEVQAEIKSKFSVAREPRDFTENEISLAQKGMAEFTKASSGKVVTALPAPAKVLLLAPPSR